MYIFCKFCSSREPTKTPLTNHLLVKFKTVPTAAPVLCEPVPPGFGRAETEGHVHTGNIRPAWVTRQAPTSNKTSIYKEVLHGYWKRSSSPSIESNVSGWGELIWFMLWAGLEASGRALVYHVTRGCKPFPADPCVTVTNTWEDLWELLSLLLEGPCCFGSGAAEHITVREAEGPASSKQLENREQSLGIPLSFLRTPPSALSSFRKDPLPKVPFPPHNATG